MQPKPGLPPALVIDVVHAHPDVATWAAASRCGGDPVDSSRRNEKAEVGPRELERLEPACSSRKAAVFEAPAAGTERTPRAARPGSRHGRAIRGQACCRRAARDDAHRRTSEPRLERDDAVESPAKRATQRLGSHILRRSAGNRCPIKRAPQSAGRRGGQTRRRAVGRSENRGGTSRGAPARAMSSHSSGSPRLHVAAPMRRIEQA